MKNYFILFLAGFLGSLTCTYAQQLPPAAIWKKCFGGSQHDGTNSIIPALDGGYILAGYSYSNDGDVTGHHGLTTTADAWIFKIDASGTLVWQKSLGGTGDERFSQVISTTDGNYLAVGYTTSNDDDVTGNHGQQDAWVVKLDRYGNIIWQKTIGGSSDEYASAVSNTNDGGYAIVGSSGSVNGDLSVNKGNSDIMLFTLSSSGNLQSLYSYGGSNNDYGLEVSVLPGNDILIGAEVISFDGDFSGTTGQAPLAVILKVNQAGQIINNVAMENRLSKLTGIIQKGDGRILAIEDHLRCYPLSGNGFCVTVRKIEDLQREADFKFNYCMGSSDEIIGYRVEGRGSVAVLPGNHIIVAGATDEPGVAVNSSRDQFDIDAFIGRAIVEWDSRAVWKKGFGGSGIDWFTGITAESEYSWVAAGYTTSNDRDVSGNHGATDSWVVKIGNFNVIKGSVYNDHNLNGVKDANEPFLNDIMVQSEKSNQLSSSSSRNGIFFNSVDTGTYTTRILTQIPYYNPGTPKTTSFSLYGQTDSLSFPLQPIPGKRDYQVDLFAVTPARPGFDVVYMLHYTNLGTDTLQNRTITMVKDSRLHFNQANPAQSTVVGDTITWTIPALLPRETGYINIELTAAAPPELNYADTVFAYAAIYTTGDLNTVNNFRYHQLIVTGSYDPNDKQEAGAGSLHPSAINAGDYLTYTIRFQNTGTDTAFNVIVKDTLSAKTDPASIEMIGASHSYSMTLTNGNICTWTFKNILLADSNRNEPLSHGYITYRVKPRNNLVLKDSIHNSAGIYFDFNLPVQTNKQLTVVRVPPPPKPVVTGIQTQYCSNAGIRKALISNLPGVTDATTSKAFLNNQAVTIATDSTVELNPSELPAGKNTLKVVFENPFGIETIEQDFQVTAAAEPEVNLTSSTTHITNLATPVIITASNAAGGGATPVYTFARDRAFNTVLQQGSSPVLNMNATELSVGDNWVYVRMKTSETCFKSETNEDSVKISRDVTTGITDPDNPGQVIRVFPNPFKGQFRLNGLDMAKVYTIMISNASGKQVLTRKITRSSSALISLSMKPAGIYLLSIYDEKKKYLIGTITLIGN